MDYLKYLHAFQIFSGSSIPSIQRQCSVLIFSKGEYVTSPSKHQTTLPSEMQFLWIEEGSSRRPTLEVKINLILLIHKCILCAIIMTSLTHSVKSPKQPLMC